jgi:SsrA-binding protein
LLHKKEIDRLGGQISRGGYTLVPLKMYFLDGRAKVELALAKGKREYDKRQALREKQDTREAQRAMKQKNRGSD